MQNNERMKKFEQFEKEVIAALLHDLFGDARKSVDENCEEKLFELEKKLKESERENTLLREKLGAIKQVEWNRKEAEEEIQKLYVRNNDLNDYIDDLNDCIFDLKQSLEAQRKINEALALGRADCTEKTGCKKVRWEAD